MTYKYVRTNEEELCDKMGWEFFAVLPYVRWYHDKFGENPGQPRVCKHQDMLRWVIQCNHCGHKFLSGEYYIELKGTVRVCPDVGDACLWRESIRSSVRTPDN